MEVAAVVLICFISCALVWKAGYGETISDKLMFGRISKDLTGSCDQVIEVSVSRCVPYSNSARSEASRAFFFSDYPTENCTVNIQFEPCLDPEGVFGKYTTYFHVSTMNLQDDDKFHIMRSTEKFSDDQPILSFTRSTTFCKTMPRSCGQVLGAYQSGWSYYKMVFATSAGNKTKSRNMIFIDTETVRQLNSSRKVLDTTEEVNQTYICPALNGRLHRIQMCEAGDRVHCPSFYEESASPYEQKAVTTRMQAYSWPLYPKYCITRDFTLTTTLAPAPTEIALLSSNDNETYFIDYATIYMDNPCNFRHILPCDKNNIRRAGTLRFLYGKLPRNSSNDQLLKTTCKIELEVDGRPCGGGFYSIFTHIKRVKLTPGKSDPRFGDSFNMLDAADANTYLYAGSRRRPQYAIGNEITGRCRTGKYTTCSTYSTAFSKDPRMTMEYIPGPDEEVLSSADRVIVDYVVVGAFPDGSEDEESRCDELKGYMPTRLMCETRDRINCPAVGSYDKREMKPVDNVQQGRDWADYNDKCVPWGFPKVEGPTTKKRTTTTREKTTTLPDDTWLYERRPETPKPARLPDVVSDHESAQESDPESDLESNTRRRRRSGAAAKGIPSSTFLPLWILSFSCVLPFR